MSQSGLAEILGVVRRAVTGLAPAAETDAELLRRFADGRDELAFEAVVTRHAAMVFGVCRRLLPAADAEDAFQATFLVLARKAGDGRWQPSVANWLHATARHVARRVRRTDARREARERRSPAAPADCPLAALAGQELRAALDEELARLPEPLRAPVILCGLEGVARDDAAAQLRLTPGALKSRLERGRSRLRAALAARGLAPALLATAVAPQLIRSTRAAAAAEAAGGVVRAPAAVLTLRDEVLRAMNVSKLKLAGVLTAVTLALAVGVSGGQPAPPAATGARPAAAAPKAAPELHAVGVYGSTGLGAGGVVDVEVRPTARPVVLAMTGYNPVTWNVRLAAGARVEKVIVSGYFAQEVRGLPAGMPVVNRSYFPVDGSRRGGGFYFAHEWNTPQGREAVRRLNAETGLPVASFQGAYEGTAFVVDGARGRDKSQPRLPRAAAAKEASAADVRAAAAGADLHVIGVHHPSGETPVAVEVRATPRPVVVALTAMAGVLWDVKVAPEARLRAVVVSGRDPQEVEGVPAGVPVYRADPDPASHFGPTKRRGRGEPFYAYQPDGRDYDRTAAALHDLTGLRVATFQGDGPAFVVGGAR